MYSSSVIGQHLFLAQTVRLDPHKPGRWRHMWTSLVRVALINLVSCVYCTNIMYLYIKEEYVLIH